MAEKMKNKVELSDENGEDEVEESTEEKCGLSLEKLNLGPRKKLFVLSLGGLPCHRVHRDEASKIPKYRYPDAAYGSFMGFKALEKKDKPIFRRYGKTRVREPAFHPGLPNILHPTHLIDDHPHKALLNPPNTAIFCTDYKVDQVNDMALGPKGELRLYLDGLADGCRRCYFVCERASFCPTYNYN